ncbi:hypothetical protein F4780DRAFT_780941 [Xylariomycetidae sp. FL0641]|nr:hypothetical protein F4780DRAFT_780941 [Xylariomycetidae sp. FL0641]
MTTGSQRGRDLAIWMAVFTAVILGTLAMRFYVIFQISRRKPNAGDVLVVIAAVCATLALEGTYSIWGMSLNFHPCLYVLTGNDELAEDAVAADLPALAPLPNRISPSKVKG